VKQVFALLLAVCACGDAAKPSEPRRELKNVARDRCRELEAEVGPLVTPPLADEELCAHVEGLMETLGGSNEALRRLAREELVVIGSAAVPLVAAWLTETTAPAAQRIASAEVLGAIDTREAAQALLERVEWMRVRVDDEPWMRAHSAWQLGSGTQDWVVPRLLLHLRYETDHETVLWLATTLAHFGNYAGLEALYVVAHGARTVELRDAAAATIAKLAADRGFDDGAQLHRAWNEGDPDHRLPDAELSAAHQLEVWRIIQGFSEWQLRGVDDGRFVLQREHSRVAPLLADALADVDRYVRTHAAQALERMGRRASAAGPALLEALDDAQTAPQVAITLGSVGYEVSESALIARLEPSRPLELRVAAAKALGRLGMPSSAGALEKLFGDSEPLDLRVAAACARVLCSPADAARATVELLLHHLTSADVESGGPETALGAWLLARSTDDLPFQTALEAWSKTPADDPAQRVSERAQALRSALDGLFAVR